MSALSHLAAHEIARDLGCLVSSRNLNRSETFPQANGAELVRAGLLTRFAMWLVSGLHRRRTARELGRLPDYMLEDIGLTRADIPRVAADLSSERGRSMRLVA